MFPAKPVQRNQTYATSFIFIYNTTYPIVTCDAFFINSHDMCFASTSVANSLGELFSGVHCVYPAGNCNIFNRIHKTCRFH